ncbi:MAG: hypothetical protein HXS53_08025 [Theionarchaea archaeon]|nr:hypothetical protein [Theionarchaea archaeon]
MKNYILYVQDNENNYSEEEFKSIISKKLRYIKSYYLFIIDKQILEQDDNPFYALIDVYARQELLWWVHTFLLNAEFHIEVNDEKLLPSATDADIQFLIKKMEERKEKTQCDPQPQSPQGMLNERAFSNREALQVLLQELCTDYESEDDLLFKSFQAETAYFLSSYIGGSSTLRWYQKPINGCFPKEGFITFRYI